MKVMRAAANHEQVMCNNDSWQQEMILQLFDSGKTADKKRL